MEPFAVWGMADYVNTIEYGNIQEVREHELWHAADISKEDKITTKMREYLQNGEKLFGWRFNLFDGLNRRTVHRAVERASLRARDRVVGTCGSKIHYLQI